MAISISAPIPVLSSSTNANSYTMSSFTPSANSILLIGVVASGTTDTGYIFDGSFAWNRLTSVTKNGGADTVYLFWAAIGSSPVSISPVFQCPFDQATGCIMDLIQMTGYDNTTINPIRQFKTNAATSTNAGLTFDASLLGSSGVYMFWGGGFAASNSSVEPGGWTEASDTFYNTPSTNLGSAYTTGVGGTSYNFTNASTNWASIGVEVYDAGIGPVTIIRRLSALGAG